MSIFASFFLGTIFLSIGQVAFADPNQVFGPFTEHFQQWLNDANNNYATYDFSRMDQGKSGSYGGKMNENDKISKEPIVFIHGNGDMALRKSNNKYQTGWNNAIDFYTKNGYTTAELYAVTWGSGSVNKDRVTADMSCQLVTRVRRFMEAVIAYTKAKKIDVVAHSQGSPIARMAIKGGMYMDRKGVKCDLGSSMASKIDSYLALGGANYGVCMCSIAFASMVPTCNKKSGMYPGGHCGRHIGCSKSTIKPGECKPNYSQFLAKINEDGAREADHVYSFWSTDDEFLPPVWGNWSQRLPIMDGYKIYTKLSHFQTKDDTVNEQYKAIADHVIMQ